MAFKKPAVEQRSPAAAEASELSFEAALERLETIVEELEGGALSLEESIARYEEGVRLSRRLTQTLDEAERRIERLVEAGEEGRAPATRPIELDLGKSNETGGEEELPF